MNLHQIVQGTDTTGGKIFDSVILTLIVVSIVTMPIETIPDLHPKLKKVLERMETTISFLFTIEYALRILTATRKRSYILSFHGVIDLLVLIPFYSFMVFGFGADLRGLRIFRLLRVFRILKVPKCVQALDLFFTAFKSVRSEFLMFLMLSAILLYISAIGIYFFEHGAQPEVFRSVPHSLWWAVTTLTTVGYGDTYPITAGGKLFSFVILMIGMGFIAVPTGLLTKALSEAGRKTAPHPDEPPDNQISKLTEQDTSGEKHRPQ